MSVYKIIPNTPANLLKMPDLLEDLPEINSEYRSQYMLKKAVENTQIGTYIFGNELNFLVWLTSEQEAVTFAAIGFDNVETYQTEEALLAVYEFYFIPTTIVE